MSNVMVTLTGSISDYFEVERTLFFTGDEWDMFRNCLNEDPEEHFPYETQISGNIVGEYEDGDAFLDSCEVTAISDSDYDTMLRLFPDGIGNESIEFPPYL